MRTAVFLDRDGVLNQANVCDGKPYPPNSLAETVILPGVVEALDALRDAGFMLIVVTNQPDVARGTMSRAVVEEINAYLADHLPIQEFRTCYHDSNDKCDCRKPLPGSLLAAAKKHKINLLKSYMVGDRWRDVEAGANAGCTTIFIDYGYNETDPEMANYRVKSITEATRIILGETY